MLSALLAISFAAIAIWLVWRFVRATFHPHQPADPVDGPFADVPARSKNPPKGRSGAVAVAEPDDDGPADLYPPRSLP